MRRRYTMLTIVVIFGVTIDQWTKSWADKSLGTVEHPVPLVIDSAEDGASIRDILVSRFGLSDGELATIEDRGPAGISQLFAKKRLVPTAQAFPVYAEQPRLAYYWVFHHRSLSWPPRRVPSGENARKHLKSHGTATLGGYLRFALPYLRESHMSDVLSQWVFPVIHTPVSLETEVRSGEVYLLMHRVVSVVNGFMQLRYAENPGAAWGLLSERPATFRRWFFIGISFLALFMLGYLFLRLRPEQHLSAQGFAWILAGAIGNFIDRLRFEYVIDFIDTYTGDLHWPTYNLADVEISIGVALLILEAVRLGRRSYLMGVAEPQPPQEG